MAYSINPNLVKARKTALLLVLKDKLSISVVARKCGVNRSTVWRWLKKWKALNHYSGNCINRPHRKTTFQVTYYKWRIITESSRPHHYPKAIDDETIALTLKVRYQLKRCAEVVWFYITRTLDISISLSSIKRIFKRYHVYDSDRYKKRHTYHRSLLRPIVTKPGSLVETDTVHLIDPCNMRKAYVYTVIDLYTRMTYVAIHSVLRPGLAAKTVLEAQSAFGFTFLMVQSDNGTEFSSSYEHTLQAKGISFRHTRLHRPNDNAHIERFNRTLQ